MGVTIMNALYLNWCKIMEVMTTLQKKHKKKQGLVRIEEIRAMCTCPVHGWACTVCLFGLFSFATLTEVCYFTV